jgi:hypothetical protein
MQSLHLAGGVNKAMKTDYTKYPLPFQLPQYIKENAEKPEAESSPDISETEEENPSYYSKNKSQKLPLK